MNKNTEKNKNKEIYLKKKLLYTMCNDRNFIYIESMHMPNDINFAFVCTAVMCAQKAYPFI